MQVVAVTVFFLLSVAFYAFFAPFLGKEIYEYIAIGIYSFLVSVIEAQFSSLCSFESQLLISVQHLSRHSPYLYFMCVARL